MRRFYICVLSCLIVLVSACATKQPNPLQNLSGTYVGQVASVINIPIKTEFSVNDQGARSGQYVMTERDGTQVSGTLDEFKQEGPYTLLVSWHDKYGNGKLRMLFSEQQRSFKGFWGHDADSTLMRWDGVKE
ncbi:MAG: hypothetical protein PHD12_07935 [Methylotenera sp.]|nr:hypothetical protein [Methylotenera sp.]